MSNLEHLKPALFPFFICIAFVLISIDLQAQREWGADENAFGFYFNLYKECNDTLIDNKEWTTIKWSHYDPFYDTVYYDLTKGYILEENSIVFYKKAVDSLPELLYDFSMEEGDSIFLYPKYYPGLFIARRVDSVEILGKTRKRIEIENAEYPGYFDLWVEGIGSVRKDFFEPGETDICDGGTAFMCFREEPGGEIHRGSINRGCLMDSINFDCEPMSAARETPTIDFSVFPNPTIDRLYVESPERIDGVKLFDGTSRLVFSSSCSSEACTLDVSYCQAGTYYLCIQTKSQFVCRPFTILGNH